MDKQPEILNELERALEPVTGAIAEIRTELETLRKAGAAPDATEVRDLEARIAELEEQARLRGAGVVGKPEQAREVDVDTYLLARAAANSPELLRESPRLQRAIDSSVIANAGRLNPEQADQFVDYLVDQTVTLKLANVRRMNAPSALIEELLVGTRKLRKATEFTAPSAANAISTRKRELSTVEVIWGEDITLTFLEDNIERRGAQNHIARLLAGQFGNDLDDLAWNGDTTLAETITDANSDNLDDTTGLSQADHDFLRTDDGWLRIASSDLPADQQVDVSGQSSAKAVLDAVLDHMPVKFLGLPLYFFVPPEFARAYANELGDRPTPLGDRVLINGMRVLEYFGYPLIPDPYLRKQGNLDRRLLLAPAANLVFGVQRQLSVDAEWKPRKRAVEYTLTARVDYQLANVDAAVLGDKVPDL